MPRTSKKPKASTASLGFEAKLWLTADKLRNNMDAAEYKHVVLGLIFLKYISDTFEEHRAKLIKGVLPKDYARPGLDKQRLGELIDVIATIELTAASEGEKTHRSVDLLGRVYEYFLTRFASAEGKNGGQFYTPSCVVRCLMKMLAPYEDRILTWHGEVRFQ